MILGMFNGDKKKTAEFCLDQFEKFIQGMRSWDCNAVSYADIHEGALFLCEDESFESILRRRWSEVKAFRTIPPILSHTDFAVECAPDFVSEFFEAMIEYMETYNGKICG
jgi:hypothetical protein